MDQGIIGKFGEGSSISQTADRTKYRGTRRLRERHLLRRERLHRVLNIMNFLPKHYSSQIDFDKRPRQFRSEEHTSELQSRPHLVCRLLLEKKKYNIKQK